jgi:ABC-2 type transport system ATP-binding protein
LTRTSIEVEVSSDADPLRSLAGIQNMLIHGQRIRFEVDTDRPNDVLTALAAVGVRGLTSQPPTLEELFLRHYQDDLVAAGNHIRTGAGA